MMCAAESYVGVVGTIYDFFLNFGNVQPIKSRETKKLKNNKEALAVMLCLLCLPRRTAVPSSLRLWMPAALRSSFRMDLLHFDTS